MSLAPETAVVPQSIWSNSYVAAGLAVLLTIEIVGLTVYGYQRIQTATAPENVADRVETAIQSNYPEIRKNLVSQVKQEAPSIAKKVSRQILAATPDARAALENLTLRQLDEGIDAATSVSESQFRRLLNQNRAEILKVFEKVEDAPDEAHRLALEIESNLENDLGVDLQSQAKAALAVHEQLNVRLTKLAGSPETLDRKAALELRMIRILRTMQKQRLDGTQSVLLQIPSR